MADDLEAIVSIPWDLEGKSCSTNVDEELALLNMKKPARMFSLIILKSRYLLSMKTKRLWKKRSQTL